MRIAVVGPSEPKQLAKFLGRDVSSIVDGMGGTPVTALVEALLNRGEEVTLATASPHTTTTLEYAHERLRVVVVPWRESARDRALDQFRVERKALSKVISDLDVDILHAHWTYEFGWPATRSRVPHLLTAHDSPFTVLRHLPNVYRASRLLLAARVRLRMQCLSAVSPYLADKWRTQMLVRNEIPVIPNIVPLGPKEPRQHRGNIRIIDIADASPRKNIISLLRAFRRMIERRDDLELCLVGPGLGPNDHLHDKAVRLGLANQVAFLGTQSRDQIVDLLRTASVLVHPSLEEAQPMVLLEAMHYDIPIVAGKRSGGVAWTLGDGKAGCLVDVRRPREIALAVMNLLGDPSRASAHARAGASLLAARHSGDAVSSAYMSAYEWAMKIQGPHA